ncbi:hypothetical protein Micau_1752 [Micromonospora aurantiaca ATCC 27029]|nr:hypothetical protein Micau_1752 [Micromonospora aurantiaca ATCC 27029]
MRGFLAALEANHGNLDSINVFAAISVSAAVTVGRVLMPQVSPMLKIYDRDNNGAFFLALRVRR